MPWNFRSIRFLLEGKARTHEIYTKLIEKREKYWEYRKTIEEGNFNILDHFVDERMRRELSDEAQERLSTDIYYTREQLLHLLADMFGAGLDTTLATMRWFLLYMCKYQEVQERLKSVSPLSLRISFKYYYRISLILQELETIPDAEFDLEHLEQCHFLRACISEVQRIRSVVPLGIPHGAVEDFKIQGHLIPKNCMILPLQWSAHMMREKWIEPEYYWPDRFLDPSEKYCQPADFIPFQTGNLENNKRHNIKKSI